jgi:hypothetical protein
MLAGNPKNLFPFFFQNFINPHTLNPPARETFEDRAASWPQKPANLSFPSSTLLEQRA